MRKAAHIKKQADLLMQGYIDEITTITENASEMDKAGQWGLDAWIRTIHDLVDLQVRTFAAVLQAGIAGPWWAMETPDEPLAADPIPVEPKPYPRKLSVSDFRRVGLPGVKIPPYSLTVEPAILPANATQLRIALIDDRFLGANYEGTVFLSPVGGGAPDKVEVTAGL